MACNYHLIVCKHDSPKEGSIALLEIFAERISNLIDAGFQPVGAPFVLGVGLLAQAVFKTPLKGDGLNA